MHRAFAVADRLGSIPRGWTILGLALAAWGLVALVSQMALSLFAYISVSL